MMGKIIIDINKVARYGYVVCEMVFGEEQERRREEVTESGTPGPRDKYHVTGREALLHSSNSLIAVDYFIPSSLPSRNVS
jgi:hypothetical protein